MCFPITKSGLNGEFSCASGNPTASSTSSASSSSVIATSAFNPCLAQDDKTPPGGRRDSRLSRPLFLLPQTHRILSPSREWPQRSLRGTEITERPQAECALCRRGVIPGSIEKFNFIKTKTFRVEGRCSRANVSVISVPLSDLCGHCILRESSRNQESQRLWREGKLQFPLRRRRLVVRRPGLVVEMNALIAGVEQYLPPAHHA